ncbi:MAG: MFS transporter [Candidatus Thermoplasmatota archaeon]|nr:MFS transporter [Candidatus Thermoplasmatota archaeon]
MANSGHGSSSDSDRRSALLVAVLSSFVTPFMGSSINIALPAISDEFSMPAVLLSWVVTSYLLAAAVFLVPFGRLADIYGRKRLFLYGMWIFVAASLLCALAPNAFTLIAFRAVQGLGSGMMFGTSVAILSSVYPPKERGRVLGLAVASVYVGLAAGPFFGGILTGVLGWRSLFVVLLPMGALVLYAGYTRLKGEWAEARGESFDLRGSAIYAVALTAVVFGLTLMPNLSGVAMSAAGLCGVAIFVLWEIRVEKPVLDMRLFRHNRRFAFSNMAALINYSATSAVVFFVSLYLQVFKGIGVEKAGIILVSQPIVMAVFSPLAGKLSDVVEPQIIASIGMATSAVGLALVALFDADTSIPQIVFALAILGFGFALFSSPNTNAIMGSVERRLYGVAAATVGTMRLIGQVLSIAIATLFISIYVGNVELTSADAEAFLESYRMGFITFAVLCALGVLASMARGKSGEEASPH